MASGAARSASEPGSAPPSGSDGTPSPGTPGSAAPDTVGSAGAAGAASTGPITLAFAGDVHFANGLAALLAHPQNSLAGLRPYLAGADLAVVNLETAITSRGTPQPKQYHFRATPSALDALKVAGVDAVTMANNHAVDYGVDGLRDTLAAQSASPIPIVGIGKDAAQAYAPAMFDVHGLKIALLGATQIPDWTLATWPAGTSKPGVAVASAPADRLVAAVRAAKRTSDVVVVYLHWGTDYTTCPNSLQERTVAALSRAGASVIVGSHAHRVEGSGWAGSTFVDYGLGNFVWWKSQEPDSRTGVLTVTLDAAGHPVAQKWHSMLIGSDGLPRAPGASAQARLDKAVDAARACSGLRLRPTRP